MFKDIHNHNYKQHSSGQLQNTSMCKVSADVVNSDKAEEFYISETFRRRKTNIMR